MTPSWDITTSQLEVDRYIIFLNKYVLKIKSIRLIEDFQQIFLEYMTYFIIFWLHQYIWWSYRIVEFAILKIYCSNLQPFECNWYWLIDFQRVRTESTNICFKLICGKWKRNTVMCLLDLSVECFWYDAFETKWRPDSLLLLCLSKYFF